MCFEIYLINYTKFHLMAFRKLELDLANTLVDTRFRFIQRGVIHQEEIFSIIKARYPNLCDDSYLSNMHRKGGGNEPEWQYVVKYMLKDSARYENGVRKFPIPEFWEFY